MVYSMDIFFLLKRTVLKQFLFFQLLLLFVSAGFGHAQNSITINAGPDTTLPCGSSCFDYKLKVPSLKSTDDYRVKAIPYNPYLYTTIANGLTTPCPEEDDKFFDVSTFGFDFCFYGETFQSMVVGTNGVMSFDLANTLNCNNWDLDPVDGAAAIPFTGNSVPCTFPCDFPSDVLYPRLSIMGVYHDLAIDEFSIDKKVEFRVEGVAPYRRAIVSFYKVPVYECTSTSATHQVIIYETTNIIDVFVKDRPPCTKWNGGNAILGIQNRQRDKGLAPPGRNLGAWGAANMNEGWRFIPNGNVSFFDHADLLLNNTVVATGVKGAVPDDSVEVNFINVCLPAAVNQYTVRAYYKTCTNGNAALIAEDNFMAGKVTAPLLDATVTDAACGANGTISITSPSGNQYKYSADGVSFQYTGSFSVLPGTYAVTVNDTVAGCVVSKAYTVNSLSSVTAEAQVTDPVCGNTAAGSIIVNTSGGAAPYTYSINNGIFQTSNQFVNLAEGIYTITIKDNAGCTQTIKAEIESEPQVILDSVAVKNISCNGLNDGSIKIYARLGVQPYSYALDAGAFQSSNIFANLAPSQNITVHVKDNSGCIKDTIIAITQPTALAVNSVTENATCSGNADGKITASANAGTMPYLYTIDPAQSAGFQINPQFAVKTGTFKVTVKDASGCIASKSEIIFLTDTMRLEIGNDTTVCSGNPVTLLPNTNQQTTVFNWQPSAGLDDAAAKNPVASPTDTAKYYLTAKWGICERKDSITINVLLKPTPNAGNDTAVCLNTSAFLHANSGRVSGPVTYLWQPPVFLDNINTANTTVSPDNEGTYLYTLTVNDNYGCNFSSQDEVTVTMQPPVPAFAGNDTAAVIGQSVHLHATGGVNYSWEPAGLFNDPFSANPLVTIQKDSSKFIVTVEDVAGCIGYDEILITAYTAQTYFVPNAFSPNGDGRNEIFKPVATGIQSIDYFRVFNRYGQIIFETGTGRQLDGWDGTFKGKKQLPGTYVWAVRGKTFSGKVIEKKGTVVLVR